MQRNVFVNLSTEEEASRRAAISANRFEASNQAFYAYNVVRQIIRESQADTLWLEGWIGYYAGMFGKLANPYVGYLRDCLKQRDLLAQYPQFDETTGRFVFDGVTFFVERGDKESDNVMFQADENALRIEQTDIYTDSRNGNKYTLRGIAISSEGRIYAWWYINGKLIDKTDWLKRHHANPAFNWMASADSALSDAMDKAQTRMLVLAGLII